MVAYIMVQWTTLWSTQIAWSNCLADKMSILLREAALNVICSQMESDGEQQN